jgi:hypothetical protein
MKSTLITTITAAIVLCGPMPPTVLATTLTVTSTADSGPGSLRAAMASAADGDTIDATAVTGTIRLTSGELVVAKNVTIVGPGPANLVVDGNAAGTVFHVLPNAKASILNLTITNGKANNYTFPAFTGGGIFNDHAVLIVSNCVVTDNSAVYGGGISNNGHDGSAELTLLASVVAGNVATDDGLGGGIYNDGSARGSALLTIADSVVSSNRVNFGLGGGGVCNKGAGGRAVIVASNSSFDGNFGKQGGAVFNWDFASFQATDVVLSGNYASAGGAIFNLSQNVSASVTITNGTLNNNTASQTGGAIYSLAQGGTAVVVVASSTISSNAAGPFYGFGGGIFNQSSGGRTAAAVTFLGSILNGNSAIVGGGIFSSSPDASASTTIIGCLLHSNLASQLGGGAANGSVNDDATMLIANSTFSGNSATNGPGGIFNTSAGRSIGSATLQIGSTILNAGGWGVNLSSEMSWVVSEGYNLSSDDGGGFLNQPTDLLNTDPMLSPLQDNGGPTFTHALLCGSPAIDKGTNFASLVTDQRGLGLARTFDNPSVPNAAGGDGTDIGAFELQAGACAPIDSDGDGVPDDRDQCPNTPPGAIVDASGCSLDQLVPCSGPVSGGTWKNHGHYVRAVIREADDFLKSGLIDHRQWAQTVRQAAYSRCGWNHRQDHENDRDWQRDWDRDSDSNWGREHDGAGPERRH